MKSLGATIAFTIGAGAFGLTAICVPFVLPAFRSCCLPFVPATRVQIQNVIKLLGKCPAPVEGPKIIDLGSGDGRIVSFSFKSLITT